jgi:hypothetical protein
MNTHNDKIERKHQFFKLQNETERKFSDSEHLKTFNFMYYFHAFCLKTQYFIL